jgi:hypothetical protein
MNYTERKAEFFRGKVNELAGDGFIHIPPARGHCKERNTSEASGLRR